MNDDSQGRAVLHAKRKQLRLMMAFFGFSMIAGPIAGPILFPNEASQLRGIGAVVFYVGTPAVFGMLLVFNLIMYRRVGARIKNEHKN